MGHPHGMFGWVDLASIDQGAAESFYTELFGWEARREAIPGGGHYVMFSLDGDNVAGLGATQGDMPSAWQSYVAVDDVDAVAGTVSGAGGAVVAPPFDVMDSGRMAVFTDPSGAFISAWQAGTHGGADVFSRPGAYAWSELATRGLDKARPFYETVFDWTWSKAPFSDVEYWLATYRGQDPEQGGHAGAMEMGESFPAEVPPHWAVYFNVEDPDAVAARVSELGGSVQVGPTDMAAGRFAMAMDPTGATFSVLTPRVPAS